MMNHSTIWQRARRALAAAVLCLGLGLGLALSVPLAAQAIPPDGPGPETPGTKSRVWPKKVKAGDRLNFEVSGYPANETVYIKIDDGLMCSDTSHGACVYHTQKLNKKGYAKGSLVVPNLAPGKHWLRMLATGDVFDKKTGEKIGYKGYTRRGGNNFTVIEGGSTDRNAGDSGTVKGGGAAKSDGTIAGGSVNLEIEDEPSPNPTATESGIPSEPASPSAQATPTESAPAKSAPAESAPAAEGSSSPSATPPAAAPSSELPVAGITALAGSVLLGGGAIGWALARRQRLAKPPAAPADPPPSDPPSSGTDEE